MESPRILTNAWFERIFDTRAWDIIARILFVLSFGFILHSALIGFIVAWHRVHNEWLWLDMAARALGILNTSIPILIVIIRRRPVARLHGFGPKAVALGGTFLPIAFFLLPYHASSPITIVIGSAFLIAGGSLALWTWPHLGRSYSLMAEARRLTMSGPYQLVRHPLYLFEEMSIIGVYVFYASPAATLILIVQIGCQLLRIQNEERVLSRTFPEYRDYQKTTSKLIPGIY